MSDLGDIFDTFSNNDEKKQRKGHDAESQDKSNNPDLKSLIINKLVENKALLITTVCIGILAVSTLAYILIGYINDYGIKDIIDNVKLFFK